MNDQYTIGGQGDGVRFSRADLVLLRRAARENWGVPDLLKNEALYQAAKLLSDPDGDARNKLAAAKLLIAAEKSDLEYAKFHHATRPPEIPDDDYDIDLSADDPAPQSDGAAA